MIALLAVLAVCGTTIYLGRLASVALVSRWNNDRALDYSRLAAATTIESDNRGLEARKIDLTEREIALREKIQAERPESVRIPDDLVGRIRLWDDPMAQENEKGIIMDLYAELQDWDKVRQRLPDLSPVMTTEPVAPRDGLYS